MPPIQAIYISEVTGALFCTSAGADFYKTYSMTKTHRKCTVIMKKPAMP
jgi:hypothetical protein